MTQLKEIVRVLDRLQLPSEYDELARVLRGVLERAQNPPECGSQADGSVNEETWTAAFEMAAALEAVRDALIGLDMATRR